MPNGNNLGLENTGVKRDEKGFIKVNEHQQTAEPSIYAIGDIVGGAMLAHKAAKEARIELVRVHGEHERLKREHQAQAVVPAQDSAAMSVASSVAVTARIRSQACRGVSTSHSAGNRLWAP